MAFLPIVDLTELTKHAYGNENAFERKALEIGNGLSTFGFLYITGHGIDNDLIKDSFRVSRDFLSSSNDTHTRFRRAKGVLLGYVDGDNEKDFPDRPPDLKRAYDFVENSPQFDALPKDAKNTLSNLWSSFRTTSKLILQLLAAATNNDRNYFLDAHKKVGCIDENSSTLRLCYYPAVFQPIQANQSRISEHTDFGTFTMLLQDNVGGLEVLSPDGYYHEVKPVANSIVINVGDLLQLWSNYHFRSTVHRVVAKPTSKRTARQSIAFFTNPDNSYEIKTPLVTKSVQEHMDERNDATVFDN